MGAARRNNPGVVFRVIRTTQAGSVVRNSREMVRVIDPESPSADMSLRPSHSASTVEGDDASTIAISTVARSIVARSGVAMS